MRYINLHLHYITLHIVGVHACVHIATIFLAIYQADILIFKKILTQKADIHLQTNPSRVIQKCNSLAIHTLAVFPIHRQFNYSHISVVTARKDKMTN